ncbi:hypothetical protein [Streptomyces sp. NPDC000351]|uniref:hypothetical protein n=1 Tax=Streptomyces sp. NPDC000351 TaxID=3154250 RepID=UPI003329AD72
MSFTKTYTYSTDVLGSDDRVTRQSGEVTVGGFEGETGAHRVVQSKVATTGGTATNIRLRPKH